MDTNFLKETTKCLAFLMLFILCIGCSSAKSDKQLKTTAATDGNSKATTSKQEMAEKPVSKIKADPGELKKLTSAEVLEMAKNETLDLMYALYKNQKGEKISQEDRKLVNRDAMGKDYYVNDKGEVKEIRVRPLTMADKVLESQIRSLVSSKKWKKFKAVDVDCSKMKELIAEAGKLDRERTDQSRRFEIDSITQVTIISIIEKCGFPTKDQVGVVGMNTVWLIFQHCDPGIRSIYYPHVVESAEKGDLDWQKVALQEDRMMVAMQMSQIYGSQTEFGGMYPMVDPKNVDKRRKEKGMEPIQSFLDKLGIDYDPMKDPGQ